MPAVEQLVMLTNPELSGKLHSFPGRFAAKQQR